MTFATVRTISRGLSEVEESTMYGKPALKWRGKLLACIASHPSAEPNTLIVRMGFDERDALIADDSTTYYLKEHYVNYDVVLVRLSKVTKDAMQDLLLTAWRRVSKDATSSRAAMAGRRRRR